MIVEIQVCRNTDRETVAKLSPLAMENDITREAADKLRNDAKHLSKVYGRAFHVEVWVWFPECGGGAYHRAYVMVDGRTVCAVGF